MRHNRYRITLPNGLFIKILVAFVPVFAIAYFSQKMVYVLPALSIAAMYAGAKPDSNDDVIDDFTEGND